MDELRRRASPAGATWVLSTLPRYMSGTHPEIARVLKEEFKVVKSFSGTLGDGEIVVRRSRVTGKGNP